MSNRMGFGDPGVLRRLILLLLVITSTGAATRLLASIIAQNGLSAIEISILCLFAITFGWITIAFWTAIAGFWKITVGTARRPGTELEEPVAGSPRSGRTALVMPVYHEDPGEVGLRIRAIWRSLAKTGEGDAFDLFILSDSRRPDVARAEEALWAQLCSELGAAGRLFYRRRTDNHGRKSGNIAEFCRRWGRRYECFVVLDADSVMSGPTVVRLARLMAANPRAGLIQTVPQPIRAETLFARIQQFASRLYSPLFAHGVAFWYPARSSYWGHNAIIRTRAFMESCGLPILPGPPPLGGEIMSHDFVEAALLRRAGWDVWLEPSLGGSYEELPPTLDDYAQRDRRWCQGNLQHARLLGWKGLSSTSRMHLAMGVMSYLASPLWFTLLLLTTTEALLTDPSDWVYFPENGLIFPVWPIARAVELIGLFSVTMGMLLLPKVLAMVLVLVRPPERRAYGGAGPLVSSVLVEILFAALLAPVLMVQQSMAVVGTLLGRSVSWNPQRRAATAQMIAGTISRYAPISLLGLAWSAVAWVWVPGLLTWLSPVVAGMVLAIPMVIITGQRSLGLAARRRGWFLVPEEVVPGPVLRDLGVEGLATRALLPAPAPASVAGSKA